MTSLFRPLARGLRLAPVAVVAALAACGDAGPLSPDAESRPSLAIRDAARGAGTSGFYFATPIAPALASYPGTFDATATPTVEICRWSGSACVGAPVATYTRSSGTGGATIALDAANQLYRVDWPTVGLSAAQLYRVQVREGSTVLGYADAKLVGPGETAAGLTAQGIVPLGNSPRLAIRFRIEKNTAPVVTITAPATDVVVSAGLPTTLSATATDAEQGDLGAQVVWRTSQLPTPLGTGATLTASLPTGRNIVSASVTDARGATTTVTRQILVSIVSVPATLNVPFGGSASLPVSLSEPAPAGGLTLTVTSSEPGRVGVSTASITIPAGQQSANATLTGVAPGASVVTVSNADYGTASAQVATTASLNVAQSSITLAAGRSQPITVELESQGVDIAAPAGGVALALVSSNPACAAVAGSATIPVGLVSTSVDVSYGGTAATPCSASITASAPGVPSIGTDVVTVTVNPAPSIALSLTSATSLGSGLIGGQHTVTLGAAAPVGGVTVTLSSTRPGVIQLSPDLATEGQDAITLFIPQASTSASFRVQGVEGQTGTGVVTASAPGYTGTVSANVSIVQPAISLVGVSNGTTALSSDDDFQVYVGIPSGGGVSEQDVRPGHVLTVTVTNANAAVAQLRKSGGVVGQSLTVAVQPGSSRSPVAVSSGGIALDPLAVGTTSVTATAPGFVSTASATQAVTVTGATMSTNLASATVGAGLIRSGYSVSLDAPAPAGGVAVTLVSSNPAALELSATAGAAGQGTTVVTIAAGARSANFFLQGVPAATGTATVTMTAAGFNTVTSGVVTVVPAALSLVGVDNATTVLSNDDANPQVYVGIPSGDGVSEQDVRPGHTITATIENSNSAVAQLKKAGGVVAQAVPVTIGAGSSRSVSGLASGGFAIDPIGVGTTTLRASAPGHTTTPNATQHVVVSTPSLSMNLAGATVGSGLMRTGYAVSLGAPAPAGGLKVTIASSAPSVLQLSPNGTTAGAGSIEVTVTAGSSSAPFVIQGVEGQTGTATITATATGFTNAAGPASVVQPIIDLTGLATPIGTSAADDPFQVRVGIPNAAGTTLSTELDVRPGSGLTVTLTTSSPAVARLRTTASTAGSLTVLLAPGQSKTPSTVANGGVALDPLTAGSTVISASAPGTTSALAATQTVTVTP